MSWNYRVMREKTPDGYWYEVHSVYYDKNSKPDGHSLEKAGVGGDSMEEVLNCFVKFQRALREPVLEWHEGEGYREVSKAGWA